MATPTCFVVMGFGKKTDFESSRTLDLDKSYRNMIKPAVEEAGLQCIRADEIVHSGLIDVPMYEQLLNADVVVADLSTSNKNAFYELGIRHALKPFTTIVVAEDGLKSPFDVNHIVIRTYHHLGEDIGFEEVMRFRKELTAAVKEIMAKEPRASDSPVYAFIKNLKPPGVQIAAQAEMLAAAAPPVPQAPSEEAMTHSFLMRKVDEAQKSGDWKTARLWMTEAMPKDSQKKDPYLLQRLALITYKSKDPNEEEALGQACDILRELNPDTSNDPETLGLWGAIHKRLWQLNKKQSNLDEAIRAYERGFYLRNDYYNGINHAFMLNERASVLTDPAWAIADYMQAQRVRNEVLRICEQWLTANPEPTGGDGNDAALKQYRGTRYWVEATAGEALIGLGREEEGNKMLEQAYAKAPEKRMQESTEEQLQKLQPLLANSPLRFLKTEPSIATLQTI